jgi:hypothetical protein
MEIFKGIAQEAKSHKSEKGNVWYSFKIGEILFSGFGEPPMKDGDTIEFEYETKEVNGKSYNNITHIHDILETHKTPDEKDIVIAKEIKDIGRLELNDRQNRRAMILSSAVNLCRERKTFNDAEIWALYSRLMQLIEEPISEKK